MYPFDFTELKRKADDTPDLNKKELLLCEALANFQQNYLLAGNFYCMQIESLIALIQKERELSIPLSPPLDEEEEPPSKNLKVSTCLIFEFLNLLGKGRNENDLTTMAKLVSLITGFSHNSILNTVQQGFNFTKRHHGIIIQEVNEVLERLQVPFLLDISKKY